MKVIINQLQDGCRRIEWQIRLLSYAIDELEVVIGKITSFSGMGNLEGVLRYNFGQLLEEEELLRQMLLVLDKVLISYTDCENKILSQYEQNQYSFVHKQMGILQISKISSIISRFIS